MILLDIRSLFGLAGEPEVNKAESSRRGEQGVEVACLLALLVMSLASSMKLGVILSVGRRRDSTFVGQAVRVAFVSSCFHSMSLTQVT
jgi:hypothetical protein